MLMSDSECDSMFDIDCLLLKETQRMDKTQDPFLAFSNPYADKLKLAVDRQASLEDLAHVIRADSHLTAPTITDAADTIQDLAKYLKDDSRSSPSFAGPSPFSFASSSRPSIPSINNKPAQSDNAPMHNYASRRLISNPIEPRATIQPYKIGSRFPVLIKEERPDTPDSDIPAPPIIRPAISTETPRFSVLYSPLGAVARRKRPIIYKEEAAEEYSEEDDDDDDQDRDSGLPPPRKYVRKNPKQIKDLDEYRKRRERNNEAVRRARAKKRQTEALIHSENRQLRAENQRLSTQLEASRLQIQTQERIIAQLRGQVDPPNTDSNAGPRLKKIPKRLNP